MAESRGLTPRSQDFSAWYNETVLRAELADYSPVRGCMVIRPYGYRIWELMREQLDRRFRETGHENAYFPLFIPLSFLSREAEHVEGFAKEAAIVTHTRLRAVPGERGKLVPDPEAALEEPLVVRPTSETIIYAMFAKWVQSYRDLPLKINQWANVVRWEMRTRLFLRTAEFLWQEGHTAHATEAEAEEEALCMLGVYREFMEEWMAMPPVTGRKSESEKFAGALRTYSCEAMMQDNRALQAGTSHNLGQNFARQFDLKFASETGEEVYAWNTSWGVSTRLVGALVMTHGDDLGLVLPPRLAPIQVVIVPVTRRDDPEASRVHEAADALARALAPLRVHVDRRESLSPGAKYYEWDAKGVPFRIEIGLRDLARDEGVLVRRAVDDGVGRKESVPLREIVATLPQRLEQYQRWLLERARTRREANSYRGLRSYDELRDVFAGPEGFVYAGWCGSPACEARVKEDTRATIRVLPFPEFQTDPPPTTCIVCAAPAVAEALWARAY